MTTAGGENRVDVVPEPWSARVRRAVAGWPGAALLALWALATWLLVHFDVFDGASLEHGWFFVTILTLTIVGIVCGTARRGRRWWATWGAGIAVGSAAIVLLAAWWIHHAGLVAESYPLSFLFWSWCGVWATGVGITGWWSGGVAVRVVRLLTAPLAVLAAFCLIDAHYGYWPTVGVLLDRPAVGQVPPATLRHLLEGPTVTSAVMPRVGQYGAISIPGGRAHFEPAAVYVWVPPDFSWVPHADESVLVMLPGWPGNVQDWVRAGQVLTVANSWARHHRGAAPIMVFVDENGARGVDTECVDGPQGNAEAYLTGVVPSYLERTYGFGGNPSQWGVVGFSEGGTCALSLAIDHPGQFGRFVDLAGDLAPNYGEHEPARVTLQRLYGGNAAAQRAHDPLLVLATHRYPDSEGWFSTGLEDRHRIGAIRTLAAAASAADIRVHTLLAPGVHSWEYAGWMFARLYPALADSLAR